MAGKEYDLAIVGAGMAGCTPSGPDSPVAFTSIKC